MSGQTISDRLLAARHSIAGQGLAKSVCKATTEEVIGPKKKHLDCKYLDQIPTQRAFVIFPKRNTIARISSRPPFFILVIHFTSVL